MITPEDFARSYFIDYKTHGNEIIPKYCPFCKGNGKDKYTFALNTDKLTYNCKRGSCGRSGTFNQLCKEFGEETEYQPSRPVKIYRPPQTKLLGINQQALDYLKLRKISSITLAKRKVSSDNKGNIIFPYYENGKVVMVKFRPAKKVEHGECKAWREEGGKPVLWGMESCIPEKPLIITEGEIDALSCEEAEIPNAVSVPSGAEDLTWVENCWEWLEQFKNIIMFGDNDTPGQEMVRKLIVKLGEYRCSIVKHEFKDANELLYRKGPEAVREAVKNAVEVPINGLLRLSDVKAMDLSNVVAALPGFPAVDRTTHGFIMGQTSLWTGTNASGKSTLLGQMMIEAINQGFPVCVFSGELPAALFKYWIDLQTAGFENIKEGKVDPKIKRRIHEWYKDQFFLYDSFGSVKSSDILRIFEYAAKRYDCKVFLIDNLMTTDFSEHERDWYHAQSLFLGKVIEFSHKFDVHTHIVAHPRKVTGKLTKNDVGGTGDLTNRPDNVFSVSRVTEEDKKENPELTECQSILTVLKNRITGKQDIDFGLTFNEVSKRFTPLGMKEKVYSWDLIGSMGEEVEITESFPWR